MYNFVFFKTFADAESNIGIFLSLPKNDKNLCSRYSKTYLFWSGKSHKTICIIIFNQKVVWRCFFTKQEWWAAVTKAKEAKVPKNEFLENSEWINLKVNFRVNFALFNHEQLNVDCIHPYEYKVAYVMNNKRFYSDVFYFQVR